VPNSVVEEYVRRVIDDGATVRVPELLTGQHTDALYHLSDRNGVGVVALRTTSLSEAQLSRLMTFRLAQYLLADLVDPTIVHKERLERDLPSTVSPDDIHLLAGVPHTGEILCYMVLRAVTTSKATLRTRGRPLFPIEQAFGWGIYNGLPVLPDLPIARIVEASRFVKNQQMPMRDEGIVRSPIEVVVALYQVLCHPAQEIAAVVGDIDQTVGKRYFGFFHIPTVVLDGAMPITPEEGFLGWAAQSRRFWPFAFLAEDFARQAGRLAVIEDALSVSGLGGVRSLLALKRDALAPSSSLEVARPPVVHNGLLEAKSA
jgi:hypothetical protein